MSGTIKKLIAERNFGFIRAENGQDVFFHASAVQQNGFASLAVGQAVNFDLERGEKGPKASNVRARREQPLS
ncbi:MAG TPA: cold shock domain-containing protein [Bryobacterales bacterium]|jgi:CspA family cold shock protein|nr:cold shock domain-containing protein [Bryobacterales bacterium]